MGATCQSHFDLLMVIHSSPHAIASSLGFQKPLSADSGSGLSCFSKPFASRGTNASWFQVGKKKKSSSSVQHTAPLDVSCHTRLESRNTISSVFTQNKMFHWFWLLKTLRLYPTVSVALCFCFFRRKSVQGTTSFRKMLHNNSNSLQSLY